MEARSRTKINGQKLKVVGYYTSTVKGKFFVNKNMIKYRIIQELDNMTVKAAGKRTRWRLFMIRVPKSESMYKYEKKKYRKSQLSLIRAFLLVGAVIIIISLVEVFLMMRASFLSRIKEVGTLGAIGVKKSDIYKMFTGEIIAITCVASVPGWLFTNYMINKLQGD